MVANPYELRADVRPLEAAALRWEEVALLMTRRADELVGAARRATEGWDAAAAESYDRHRRQVLADLDRFTTLATQVAGSLRAVSALLTTHQKELDQAWATVATVPHDVVGESRHLVFRPTEDADHGRVARGQEAADAVRGRLAFALDQEGARLRTARAELVDVHTELVELAGGAFPGLLARGEEPAGVGRVPPPSTGVAGSAQAGVVAGVPPIAPVSVAMPDLTGIAAGARVGIIAAAAAGLPGPRASRRRPPDGVPPVGGMGAGAMAARAGTMARGATGGGGRSRPAASQVRTPAEDGAARAAREEGAARDATKEAKRAALVEKRAARAARKAERAAITVVHHAPGEEPEGERR